MKLNDCPVCSSQYIDTFYIDGKYFCSCEDCNIRTQNYDSEEDAQVAWNSLGKHNPKKNKVFTLRFKKLNPKAVIPVKGDPYAACYDLTCPKGTKVESEDGIYIVPLGFAVEIPQGYHAKIYPRSSMPLKYKATLANSVGIIDSGYLDEWKLLIEPIAWDAKSSKNLDYHMHFINECHRGVKLAQVEFVRNGIDVEFEEVDAFGNSYNRGGGFGSTGA